MMKLKEKLPVRRIKYDKRSTVARSAEVIKYKDQLYKVIKGTAQSDPSYTVKKHNLSAYNKIPNHL